MQDYALGCPIWANKEWVGKFFAKGTKPASFLREYATVFNAVEGNTTFYALPSPDTVEKWNDETPEGFEFCLKFHRSITHDKRLRETERELEDFFSLFAPLRSKLGSFLIQLPPSFGSRELPALVNFLEMLPSEFRYAVEVRHRDFFRYDRVEERLDQILTEHQVDRVILDARGLHQAMAQEDDQHTEQTQMRKPLLPIHYTTTSARPLVRYISHPVLEQNIERWHHWVHVLSHWTNKGQRPYFFMHAPNNTYAPMFARHFHQLLQTIDPSIPAMPVWPNEKPPEGGEQISLF